VTQNILKKNRVEVYKPKSDFRIKKQTGFKTLVKTVWILWSKDFRKNRLDFKNFGLYPLIFMDLKTSLKPVSVFGCPLAISPVLTDGLSKPGLS